jgi:hypothetical protein
MGYKIPLMVVANPSSGTATRYFPVMNCSGNQTTFTDIGSAETPFFEPGKITNLYVNPWANASTGDAVFTLVKNGVDTALTLTVPATGGGRYFDNVNTVTVVAGDVLAIRCDKAGTGAIQVGQVGVYYETDSGVIVNKVGVMGSQNSATGTGYLGFIGDMTAVTDNSAAQTPEITVAGTVKNFHAYSNANTRTNTTTIRPRYNGANGSLVVTFPASTAGLRTDSANSDALAVNDNFNFQRVTNTGSGTFTLRTAGCEIHYPANEANLFSCDNGGIAITATTARFMAPSGSFGGNGSENAATMRLYGSGVMSDFYYNVSVSTTTAAATVDVRKNNASTAITTSLGIAATGTQSDTTNTATFADEDYLNYRYIKPTGSGAVTFRWFSLKLTYDLPAVTFIPQAVWFM